MRIAYVVHDYNRKLGHSRYVAELASRFKVEHDVHIYANTFEDANPEGLTFHYVPAWRRFALASILSFILPATWSIRGRFDIIHAQGLCGLKQNVLTAHICQGAWYEAMAAHSGRPSWRKRLFHALTERLECWTFRPAGARRVIAVSGRIRDDLAHYYGRREGVRVIPHGVDTELFHPDNVAVWRTEVRREIGISDETCVALYVGDAQKALPAAIRAMPHVPHVHLVSVSRSPSAGYVALSEREGVRDRVHLIPASDHIERYYAAADFFVFPTFYDSFGLVAAEAMASGLPIICSTAAGAAELIEDGVNGLLVADPWNPAVLGEMMNRLAQDASLRRLGLAARRTALDHTWDRVAAQTMAVYREIVPVNAAEPVSLT
jgi:UDP-glucose:(heptosyl)LPS alpha-1,3-glucosyltransferase